MKQNVKWIPEVGQSYYFITFDSDVLEFQCDEEILGPEDGSEFDMPIFSSAEECVGMCSYLNELLKNTECERIVEEKKFDVVAVFGECAVRDFMDVFGSDDKVSIEELESKGSVVRHSFATEAERDAYMLALEDSAGWLESVVADEKNLKP